MYIASYTAKLCMSYLASQLLKFTSYYNNITTQCS